ncbi:hypothetical protein [Actinacidiphila acidipaludis]|uniref:Lipoprotein n=1 Tax=Actinacidiphila acidipaludis TaxID=2873382 RepID=A0ABS7Q3Q2_9ACTN|nr:hypothetical protein [Streptomyces acidipaludis]MBY8876677.1 hypothetical protein [Streptomyces acidipaludis]
MRCRSRTYTATGIAAAAVAAALTLSGCSSDSGGQSAKSPSAGAPATGSTPSSAAPATAPTSTASGDTSHGIEGVWLATQDGTKVQLVLGKGHAGLTSTSLCGGSYTDKNGIGLTLTCMDGNKQRTSGHGTLASDGNTLTVQWSGGLTDTFSRTGLPSN